ncbi:N-acetylglucosamine-6-phosphate deacetylase [Sutcliffiella rhizosphaerae]|uniref:N-acetylglucosamine-6-phosphate deacetylase n=1 Tax=Sutcliffiella rhizosphaerae TaxID=2880967 RepID=A0ABN8AA89_9BACI|nr:N-acetylglucosamine-6-phosphate deacetylase [Sutcliffiella rhizosphaerae]CAG9619943.1 N-acetylglucosamine-6-phosphate deacetylase [Sutcliffiella rhizosphaerae]
MTCFPDSYALTSIQIITEQTILKNSYIKWINGKISEYGPMEDYENSQNLLEIALSENLMAAPGFIDIHLHGSNGADVMDGTDNSLHTMATSLLKEGTTSFLATTITNSPDRITKALNSVQSYMTQQKEKIRSSQMLGVHLEGPFINPIRAGAQPISYIQTPSVSAFHAFQEDSGNNIKVVTLAPEQLLGYKLVEFLAESGVIASIGHSDATYDEMGLAIIAGAQHVTHFYNGMRGIHHREPGVVGAGLAHPELILEVIADGIHVHPAVIKATYLAKGADGLILITDSMRAKWLGDGEYELGGQKVSVRDNTALLEDGTLAGSVLKMNEAVKNMISFSGCTISEAIQMASTNPAKQLNLINKKGSIALGKDADIIILDENLDVKMTFCQGQLLYKGE